MKTISLIPLIPELYVLKSILKTNPPTIIWSGSKWYWIDTTKGKKQHSEFLYGFEGAQVIENVNHLSCTAAGKEIL